MSAFIKKVVAQHEDFVLILGESLTGQETIDLSKSPDLLIGGGTGSGKSVLLKSLLAQAYHKGAEIYIADMKGGVDFPLVWHEKCEMVFEELSLNIMLTSIIGEMERRKGLFRAAECSNIETYNAQTDKKLKRIIFACDEVAELFEKTGKAKEEKEVIAQIESALSKIARWGRAFGIHLVLATQRPDANILPGQIRSNLDFRICGRADNVLSQIILDNTSAADQIPKDAQGRFITNTGVVFQAYWFDDSSL